MNKAGERSKLARAAVLPRTTVVQPVPHGASTQPLLLLHPSCVLLLLLLYTSSSWYFLFEVPRTSTTSYSSTKVTDC